MVKKKTILQMLIGNVLYYQVIPMILLGIGLLLFDTYFIPNWIPTDQNIMYQLLQYTISIGLLFIWLLCCFALLREKQYKRLTGRSYTKDHKDFQKTFQTLTKFFSTNDKYRIMEEDLPIEDWHHADGVILAKYKDRIGSYRLVKRPSAANGNLISFGLPGSGKSTTQAATTAVRFNTDLNPDGCGIFAISIKGDLLNFVHGKRKNIKVFTPDRESGSCHYNPLDGITQMSQTERRSFVETMSQIICPEEQGENAAFFVNGARDYFCAITLYLLYLHDTGKRPGELRFPEIVDSILASNVFDVTLTIKKSGCKIAGEYSNSYEGSSEKNVSGIYNHLCKSVRPFNNGAIRTLFDGQGNCITPDFLNYGDIYIDVPQDKYTIYAPAMAIIITNFLMAFMRRPDVSSQKEVVPILFLLDEAVQLNLDFQILSQAMSTLRSKKVSLFLLLQSIAQLEGRYGEAHSREIMDLCAYISIFNAQDPKSREYFQKLIGKRKMLQRSTSLSSSETQASSSGISISEIDEYIFDAADFGNLNRKIGKSKIENRVLVYANGKYILGETTPCYE